VVSVHGVNWLLWAPFWHLPTPQIQHLKPFSRKELFSPANLPALLTETKNRVKREA
jgi:hypothetical protein